jgi:predicted enzyme related to lactoylglutathione lyase
MSITGVVIRHRVTDLDATTPFYEELTGRPANRFAFSGAELAAVGPFLLFSAPGETGDRLAGVVATLTVTDLDAHQQRLVELGAEIVAPPADTPNGRRMIVRHPDGAVFEYVGP